MNLKLPPHYILLLATVTFLFATFIVIRGLITDCYNWGFWLAALYFGVGGVTFFFLLLSVDNNLRYQRLSGLSLNKDGDLEFKRMEQFAEFLQISEDQLAKDFSMINSKLKKKATAKELMNDIAKVIVRDGVPYEKIIKDFRRKDPESLSDTKNQLFYTAFMHKV